jgi:hypothetical protein
MSDPREWNPDDRDAFVTAFDTLLATDYQQLVDLGRFIAGGDPYFVR